MRRFFYAFHSVSVLAPVRGTRNGKTIILYYLASSNLYCV